MLNVSSESSALTWRVVLAIIYGILVFQPAAIWLNLVTGLSPWMIINAAEYTTLLFFVTIAVFMGSKLSRQEAFILFSNVGTTVSESLFAVGLINAWFIAISEYAKSYGLIGRIPFWYAPSDPYIPRTIFQSVFIPPLLVSIASALLTKGMDLSLAYVLYRLYVVEEKLPFPGARVWAESSIVLAEKHVWRDKAKLMSIVAIFSFLYSIPLYGLRFALDKELIPIPWADFTPALERIGLKGASLGISFDLLLIAVGLIMPWRVNVSIFIGGLAYIIFLPIATRLRIFTLWRPGYGLDDIYQLSLIQLFVGPLIGLSIASGVAPMIINWRSIVRLFKPPKTTGAINNEERFMGLPLTKLSLILYIAFSISLSIFAYIIVYIVEPEVASIKFLILFTILITGFSALFQFANTRAIGESSLGINIPYVREASLLGSGYRGVAAWFTPLYVYGGASGWTAVYAACDWTGTRKSDYIKAYLIAFPLTYIMSIIYADIFWRIAPIPSAYYPATAIFWRVSAMWTLLWPAWSSGRIKMEELDERSRALMENLGNWPSRVLLPLAIGSIIVIFTKVLHIPFELVGFTIGLSQPVAYTVTMFIGGIIARILEKKKGSEWFREYVAVISAGLGLGEGLLVALSLSIALIRKSIWLYAY